jgi:hypothetical protein
MIEASLGEPTLALGYVGQKVGRDGRFLGTLHGSDGTVEEIHNYQRDSSFVNFPSFRTSGGYFPGMSGEPVIDKRTGAVIGVVSSSVTSDDTGAVYGYAASLGGLVALAVLAKNNQGVERPLTVPELFAASTLDVPGGVRVEASPRGSASSGIPTGRTRAPTCRCRN